MSLAGNAAASAGNAAVASAGNAAAASASNAAAAAAAAAAESFDRKYSYNPVPITRAEATPLFIERQPRFYLRRLYL